MYRRRRVADAALTATVVVGSLIVPALLVAWFMQILVNGFHHWWSVIPFMTYGDAFDIWFQVYVVIWILGAGITWIRSL